MEMSYNDLTDLIARFDEADLLDPSKPIQLQIGNGGSLKKVITYKLCREQGLVLVISGNQPAPIDSPVETKSPVNGKVNAPTSA